MAAVWSEPEVQGWDRADERRWRRGKLLHVWNKEENSTTWCLPDYLLEVRKRGQVIHLALDIKIRGHVDMGRSQILNAWSTGERQTGSI